MDAPSGWEVRLPERGRRRAQALVVPAGEGVPAGDPIPVPVSVGRRLARELASAPAGGLTRAEVADLAGRLSASCARERTVALVNRRDYSSKELSDKLLADGYAKGVASATTRWACEVGLVDDERFAASFARAKALSGWGRARIERELERRGVSPQGVLADEELLGREAELERARSLARRRVRGERSDFARVARFLANKGYSPDVTFSVARELAGGTVED